MANPILDTWNTMASWFQQPSTSQPNVTMNTQLPTAGKYDPEGVMHHLISKVIPGLVHPGGSIQINPNNTADVQRILQHEKVHALLDGLNEDGTLDRLNAANPYFKSMASKILVEPGGDISTEAPAYAATGEAKQFGIDPKISTAYQTHLQKQLTTIDPKLGAAYGQLSQ